LIGDFDLFVVVGVSLAGEIRRFFWAAAIISAATPTEELREAMLAVVQVYRHDQSPP
jgi:hypothetical protein